MPGIDVQEVMRAIRERVRAKAIRQAANADQEGTSAPALPELIHVRSHIAHSASKFECVGQMPPAPPTLRARVGSHAVRFMQRGLFWLTAQLREAHEALLQTQRVEADALQQMIEVQRFQQRQIEWLKDAAVRQQQVNVSVQCQWEELLPQWDEMGLTIRRVHSDHQALQAESQALAQQLESLRLDVQSLRSEKAALRQSIDELVQARQEAHASSGDWNDLMAAHGARFRGEPDEIRRRLEVYLPFIDYLRETRRPLQAIDLGCGRGEWLEVLAASGVNGLGIESNPLLVQHCCELGLAVQQGDVVDYLRSLPDESVDIVSAFHLIEHLPLGTMLQLLRQIQRVLVPDGLFLLETPNSASLFVGSHTFYLDPTHVRPVPPELASFLLEYFGFSTLTPLVLQPFPERFLLPAETNGVGQRFNEYFYSGQDFGLVAHKARVAVAVGP